MKKGWIIYSKDTLKNHTNNAFDWMISEAKRNDLDVQVLFEEDFNIIINEGDITLNYNNSPIEKPNFILLRSYCIDLANAFESLSIPLFNTTKSLNKCRNKWTSHLICAKHNIPSPKTIYGTKKSLVFSQIMKTLSIPFVLKEVIGSKGEQVYLINNKSSFDEIITNSQSEVICQEFISESKGKDIRIHVIGGKAIVGIERIAKSGFKSNFSLGGKSREFPLTDKLKKLAVETANAHGLAIAGVDVLISNRGPLICEVNGISAFRTVAINTDINLPYLIFNHIGNKI